MRVSLVTGGGRGIGRAIALALAGPDTCVAVAARTRSEVDSTARELAQLGGRGLAIVMDVSDEASVTAGIAELRRAVDHVDVLVNNAGVGGGETVEGSDVARWRRTIDTNLTGMYLVTRAVVALIPPGGRIVNMSSVLGRFGVSGYTAYCASKHGVIGFTRALALELTKRRVTVNALCPGWVNTAMTTQGMLQGAAATGKTVEQFREQALGAVPIGRIIEPAEVAELVRFVASPATAAVTGQTYNICGGQTMA
jgi:NAD(P)-dependent dehydrogenase (short-subunit alcohol dehydrogenase family)